MADETKSVEEAKALKDLTYDEWETARKDYASHRLTPPKNGDADKGWPERDASHWVYDRSWIAEIPLRDFRDFMTAGGNAYAFKIEDLRDVWLRSRTKTGSGHLK